MVGWSLTALSAQKGYIVPGGGPRGRFPFRRFPYRRVPFRRGTCR